MTRNLVIALCLSGGLLAAASGPAAADVTRDGRIYGLDPALGTVTIDENRLKVPSDLEIHNLDDGGSSGLVVGEHVRYTLDDNDQLRSIWIYPNDPRKRRELGYNPAQQRQ